MLPGITPMNIKGSPIIPFSFSYLGHSSSTLSAASYSFNFTVPSSTATQELIIRFSFLSAAAAEPTGTGDVTSITWNGISGTRIDWEYCGNSSNGWAYQTVYRLIVPPASSGVTAAVVTTLSLTRLGGSTTCYLLTAPKKTTQDDSATALSSGTTPGTSNVNTVALTGTTGGVALIFSCRHTNSATTFTGSTKNMEVVLTSVWSVSAGSQALAATGSANYTVTASTSSFLNCVVGVTLH